MSRYRLFKLRQGSGVTRNDGLWAITIRRWPSSGVCWNKLSKQPRGKLCTYGKKERAINPWIVVLAGHANGMRNLRLENVVKVEGIEIYKSLLNKRENARCLVLHIFCQQCILWLSHVLHRKYRIVIYIKIKWGIKNISRVVRVLVTKIIGYMYTVQIIIHYCAKFTCIIYLKFVWNNF